MRLSLAVPGFVALFALGLFVVVSYADNDEPGDALENVDSLLRNKSFMKAQINCVRGDSKCDRVGRRIKGIVKELQNLRHCASCNDQERGQMLKVINYVKIHYRGFWEELNIDDEAVQDLR